MIHAFQIPPLPPSQQDHHHHRHHDHHDEHHQHQHHHHPCYFYMEEEVYNGDVFFKSVVTVVGLLFVQTFKMSPTSTLSSQYHHKHLHHLFHRHQHCPSPSNMAFFFFCRNTLLELSFTCGLKVKLYNDHETTRKLLLMWPKIDQLQTLTIQ